jgi:hypothetical protein
MVLNDGGLQDYLKHHQIKMHQKEQEYKDKNQILLIFELYLNVEDHLNF